MIRLFSLVLLLLASLPHDATAQELTRLEGCRLIPTEWADGDSFLVETADGQQMTVRLYGVDCVEKNVTDESDARRLRAQRRYFGISDAGGTPQESIDLAKEFGRLATEETRKALSKPFTLHTNFADARGDGRYKRIYGFITISDGTDLGERLVNTGHARAFGVLRQTPDGQSRDDYRDKLRDLELRAAKLEHGIWKHTNWEKLPDERRLQREEEEEIQIATGNRKSVPIDRLDPNLAARDELMSVPGIGEVMANRIIENRPYATLEDLQKVPGIGSKTLETLRESFQIPEVKK